MTNKNTITILALITFINYLPVTASKLNEIKNLVNSSLSKSDIHNSSSQTIDYSLNYKQLINNAGFPCDVVTGGSIAREESKITIHCYKGTSTSIDYQIVPTGIFSKKANISVAKQPEVLNIWK